LPAIKKAVNRAKMTLIRVNRGCGSWECGCGTGHSVPFKVEGRCGSVQIRLLPAPQGTGLVVGESVKDVFRFVGIRDVWAKTRGSPDTVLNFVGAAVDALGKTSKMRYSKDIERKLLKDEQGE
jgi:small subunit ribosomal protein S5